MATRDREERSSRSSRSSQQSGFSRVKPTTRGNDNVRINEMVDTSQFKPNKWQTYRLIPGFFLPVATYWFDIITKTKKKVPIPKRATNFDPMEDDFIEGQVCPYAETGVRMQKEYYANAISRSAQDDEPRKKGQPTRSEEKTGFKEKGSKAWTPVEALRAVNSLMEKLLELKQLNTVKLAKGTKNFPIDHPKYGCDVSIKYVPDASGTDKWQVQLGSRTPLTEDELEYLVWDLEALLPKLYNETAAQAKAELRSMNRVEDKKKDDDDDDDDDDIDIAAKRKKKNKKMKADDDDVDDWDDDDDDDAPPPRKKKKKRPVDDDDDDDDDAPPPRKKKRPVADDDDDDDEPPRRKKKRPVDDDDDDDDEPPRRKKKRPVDDDDDDDAPPRRKKKRPVDDDDDDDAPPARSKKKKRPVDDDDEDDLSDLDEDDDAPPARSKKKKRPVDDDDDDDDAPSPRRKKKKRPVDDDDDEYDDDDIPF